MSTIEQRAEKYAEERTPADIPFRGEVKSLLKMNYIEIATQQRILDIAEMEEMKEGWRKAAEIDAGRS